MTSSAFEYISVDDPREAIRRITLDRPKKRNALSNALRGELFQALEEADRDQSVRVTILRGAGDCFTSGYDLAQNATRGLPFPSSMGDGFWPRHVVEGAFKIWDLAKPVIAQVHGYCLAGGSELMAACDLAYAADDAQIGYPPVRLMSPPDNQFFPWMAGMRNAMELMLTGDAVSGVEAAAMGLVNRSYPPGELEEAVLGIAERVAMIPSDLQQLNKRTVHRAMEIMGMRAAIRSGTEIQALAFHQPSAREHLAMVAKDLKGALAKRDGDFGDYRAKTTTKTGTKPE